MVQDTLLFIDWIWLNDPNQIWLNDLKGDLAQCSGSPWANGTLEFCKRNTINFRELEMR